jgi:single-strand DNA-binding protein
MYHKVIIVGHLGRDPEMRYTPSGQPVTNFSMATTRKWTGGDGNPAEETVWVRVTAWGKLGETCNQYLSKGRLVLIEGRLTPDRETGGPRVYQRRDGTYGASYEITAENVRFLGRRDEVSPEVGGEPFLDAEPPPMTEDEIPF